MDYIQRTLQSQLIRAFEVPSPKGLILAGIVGCGKTTLIQKSLEELSKRYQVFSFTGDNIQFRREVFQDSTYLHRFVRSRTQESALVFVDEVQKSEEIFDALKYAFDESGISFIVSGSNPKFLNTQAKKRLQRRADLLILNPLSIKEIFLHLNLIPQKSIELFLGILNLKTTSILKKKIQLGIKLNEQMEKLIDEYLVYGGLPLAYLTKRKKDKFIEIRKVVERGFEALSVDNDSVADTIRVELAQMHSQEFAYQGLFQKTGIRRRDIIKQSIDELINQGYLLKKKPLVEEGRRSYLSVYSYVDPGIVTYLTSETDLKKNIGTKVEGVSHMALEALLNNQIPLKSSLHYFKPYTIDINGKVKYHPGEIDFVIQMGSRLIPIEVKATADLNAFQVPLLKTFIREKKLPFGIVLYKGVPYWENKDRLLYWPFWLI